MFPHMILPMKMLSVWLLVICVCGCSPQKSLAKRLKGADRVVVTNTQEGLSISITGEDVDKIVQAIASARKESRYIQATPGYWFEFFKGAEHLETVVTSGSVYWIEHTPYSDTAGAQQAIYGRFRHEIFLREHPPEPP